MFLWGELFLYFPIFLFLEVGSPITGWPPTPGPPAFTSHWVTSAHYQARLWGFPKATELAKARADPVKPLLPCGMKNTRPRMARTVQTEALENLQFLEGKVCVFYFPAESPISRGICACGRGSAHVEWRERCCEPQTLHKNSTAERSLDKLMGVQSIH